MNQTHPSLSHGKNKRQHNFPLKDKKKPLDKENHIDISLKITQF